MAKDDENSKGKAKKPSKKFIYLIIILIVIFAECAILYYDYTSNEDNIVSEISNNPMVSDSLGQLPVVNDFLNSTGDASLNVKSKVIGKNDIGSVSFEGPYGNPNSTIKVAYVLGQHPREYNAHDAIYDSLQKSSNELNYSYYVYRINVTGENEDFEESRMNGQLLAEEFVVNHSIKKHFNLAIDIHSSNGGYLQDPYIFAPVSSDIVANESADNLTKLLNYIVYYVPASYSSPQYSTIPMDEGGVPSIVYEMRGNPDRSLESEANDLIFAVEKLKL